MAVIEEEQDQFYQNPETELAYGESQEYLDEESRRLKEEEAIQPEVVEGYASPFGAKFGSSSVDLTTPGSNDKMLEEYNEWWRWDRNDPQRDVLREAWTQKYYGMGTEEYRDAKKANATTMYGQSANLQGWANQMDNNFQALSTAGLGWADFVMDSVGTLGGPLGSALDDRWDKATQLDNKTYQEVRKILSVVLPSIQTGKFTEGALVNAGVKNMPRLQQALTRLGAWSLEGAVIGGLSDTSEDPYNLARTMAEVIPGAFGPEGFVPLPEGIKTTDEMSPAARKKLSTYENVGLAWLSVIAGSAIRSLSGAKRMGWFTPKSPSAAKYKQLELTKVKKS